MIARHKDENFEHGVHGGALLIAVFEGTTALGSTLLLGCDLFLLIVDSLYICHNESML